MRGTIHTNLRNGYVLIEVMISTVIAATLATGLLTMIMQITNVQSTINSITSIYGRAAIFQQQLERDLMGAFVPTQIDLLQTQTGKLQEKGKPVEKIFYGESKGEGGRLDYFTFITTNPLELFFGIKDVKLKPRVARIVYQLMPDSRQKNSYVLWRQEGTSNLHFDTYKQDVQGEMRSYAMIDGIQELSVRFVLIEEKEEGKDQEKKRVSYTYKRKPNWKDVEDKKDQPQPKEGLRAPLRSYPKIPQQVEFTLSLWDINYEKFRTFVITIPIESRYGQFEKPQDKKEEDKKEDENVAPKASPKPVGEK